MSQSSSSSSALVMAKTGALGTLKVLPPAGQKPSLKTIEGGSTLFKWLTEDAALRELKRHYDHQKEVVAECSKDVEKLLQSGTYAQKKWRAEFSLEGFAPEVQKQIGLDVYGLRVGKRSRLKALSNEKLADAISKSCQIRLYELFEGKVSEDHARKFGNLVIADVAANREKSEKNEIVPVRKVDKDGRKRKIPKTEEVPFRLSQTGR